MATLRISIYLLSLALCGWMSGCTSNPTTANSTYQPVDTNRLMPMTAEFITHVSMENKTASTSHWRLLRDEGRIELNHLDAETSEIWQKSSKELWFYNKVFHHDKQVIEYSPMDLSALGVNVSWVPVALAIDPEILSAFAKGKPGKAVSGWNSIVYKGKHGAAQYEIHWLPQLAIAAKVIVIEGGVTTTTEMHEPLLMEKSPWQFSDIRNYRLIDFSDLGDMERDPFVIKIQNQVLGSHAHAH